MGLIQGWGLVCTVYRTDDKVSGELRIGNSSPNNGP